MCNDVAWRCYSIVSVCGCLATLKMAASTIDTMYLHANWFVNAWPLTYHDQL